MAGVQSSTYVPNPFQTLQESATNGVLQKCYSNGTVGSCMIGIICSGVDAIVIIAPSSAASFPTGFIIEQTVTAFSADTKKCGGPVSSTMCFKIEWKGTGTPSTWAATPGHC